MIAFIDNSLKKMGLAFGIVFKILIPAVLFYYPFKMLLFGSSLLSAILGPNLTSISQHSQIIATILYVVFVLLLIFRPKVASVIEFVVFPLYLVSLYYIYPMLFHVNFYSLDFTAVAPYIKENKLCVPLLVIFIIFKILFFIFIILNKKRIENIQNRFATQHNQ